VVFFPEDDGKSLQAHKRVHIEELKKVMIVAV